MKSLRVMGLCLAIAAAPSASAQTSEEKPSDSREAPGPGIWFSPKLLRLTLDRAVDELDDQYDFDDEQYLHVRKIFHERVPQALEMNRGAVIEIFNGYFEAYMDIEPPDSQYIADWAQKSLPRLQVLTDTVHAIAEDMRPVLNDEQLMLLEGQVAGFTALTETLDQRLHAWAEGSFDAETEWHRAPGYRAAEVARRNATDMKMLRAHQTAIAHYRGEEPPPLVADAAKSKLTDTTTEAPKDEWARCVQEMIDKYEFDTDQQQRSWQYYRSAADDRDRYLRRRLPDMDNVEQSYDQAEKEEQRGATEIAAQLRARAEATLAEIDADVERLFERFKKKLETIPRRAQRRAAAEREAKRSEVTE